jgi:hypothetical protein
VNNYLQNPYYFMYASLAKESDDTEMHWLKVGSYQLLGVIKFSSILRMGRLARQQALWSLRFIISRILKIRTRTLAFLSSRI